MLDVNKSRGNQLREKVGRGESTEGRLQVNNESIMAQL